MSDQLIITEAPELKGVEQSKADQIKAAFEPMVEMLKGFESEFNEVVSESKKGITEETTKRAKRVRLDIAKVRIEAEKTRKEQKEEYLRAGKAIDGVSNILKWAVVEKENALKKIEQHFENLEKERLRLLQIERIDLISKYIEDAEERDLSSMEQDVWDAYLSSKRKAYEDRIEAEKKAEAERIAKEKAEAEERERIRLENERLKKEAEEREKLERERIAKEAKERAEREAKERAEREAYEAKLKAEREAREKFERELKEKAEAERIEAERIEAERVAAEKKKAEAGDLEKLYSLLNDLKNIEFPNVDSAVAKDVCAAVMSSVSASCQEIEDAIILIEQ
jgi:chemosensory pili system protein ChpA (sensor histidine kinase/response regulator)